MEGIFIFKAEAENADTVFGSEKIKLLAKGDNIEIMNQRIVEGATVWLVPSNDPMALEFFFIHSGEIEVGDDCETRLTAGESFYACGLKQEVLLKARKESEVLYISNRPVFEESYSFQDYLTKLLGQINDKDHYTFQHSRNVMRYSVGLYEKLKALCPDTAVDDIVVAALFHDVGKCYTADSILKKNGRLEPDEYRQIKRHPIDSARLLRPYFGER